MAFLAPLMLGAAASGTTAATAGLFGAGGAMTAGATLSTLGTAASVLGGLGSAAAAKASAKAEKQQLDYAAGQATAAGQHEAELRRRKTALMLSRGLAVNAASGGGTSGIEGILAGLTEEGERGAQGALYEATEQAKGLRYKGEAGVAAAKARANATILGGIGQAGMSLVGRFAPSAAPTAPADVSGWGYGSRYDPTEARSYVDDPARVWK